MAAMNKNGPPQGDVRIVPLGGGVPIVPPQCHFRFFFPVRFVPETHRFGHFFLLDSRDGVHFFFWNRVRVRINVASFWDPVTMEVRSQFWKIFFGNTLHLKITQVRPKFVPTLVGMGPNFFEIPENASPLKVPLQPKPCPPQKITQTSWRVGPRWNGNIK